MKSNTVELGPEVVFLGLCFVAVLYYFCRSREEYPTRREPKKFAIDCEMVGAPGGRSQLASVSVVDENYRLIYSEVVRPRKFVTQYRTQIHGLTPDDLLGGKHFKQVQMEVAKIIANNILIGHSVQLDLAALNLTHPLNLIRDVATFHMFQVYNKGYKPSLKNLARYELGYEIQNGYHSSHEDALACMRLYKKVSMYWG